MFVFLRLTSLCTTVSSPTYIYGKTQCHSCFMAEQYSTGHMYHTFFIHSFLGWWTLGLLPCSGYYSAAMNTAVYVSFWIMIFSGGMTRSGIAGSYGNSSFLRNLYTILHNGYINLHSHKKCMWGPFSPHHLQHLLFIGETMNFWLN